MDDPKRKAVRSNLSDDPCRCRTCKRLFATAQAAEQHQRDKHMPRSTPYQPSTDADWNAKCEVCDASPIVPATGMCGPCTFGEADTANGNW